MDKILIFIGQNVPFFKKKKKLKETWELLQFNVGKKDIPLLEYASIGSSWRFRINWALMIVFDFN